MIQSEPIFCFPALDDSAYIQYLESSIEASSCLDGGEAEVLPGESAKDGGKAVEARLSILRRTYRGEYYTDSHELPRLANNVATRQEYIWFWGSASEIDQYRSCSSGSPIVDTLKLGTVSVIDAGKEFGEGYAELCRSASMTDASIRPYALKRVLDFMTFTEATLSSAFHTLFLVPRVRKSSANIRGGEAVNTLHKKYIRSRFYGFAPWYVMQGNVLECLEYREIHRSVSDLRIGVRLFLASKIDASYVKALMLLNFPSFNGMCTEVVEQQGGIADTAFCKTSTDIPAISKYNHVSYFVADDLTSEMRVTLDQIEAQSDGYACAVIHLNLEDPRNVCIQLSLAEAGFYLCSISPARKEASLEMRVPRSQNKTAFRGTWCKPNPKWELAYPFYEASSSDNPEEVVILNRLKMLAAMWQKQVGGSNESVHP